MRSPNRLIAYEHTHNYCYHLDRKGISVPRSGLELSHGPWLYRERSFFDAVPSPMGGLGAAGGKCDSSIVLVLEHRWQRSHVHLLRFPPRSDWDSGVSPKLAYLHSQFDADPKTPIRFHGRRAFAKAARNRIAKDRQTLSRLGRQAAWCDSTAVEALPITPIKGRPVNSKL
jgi:hypothetical protein